MIETERAGQGPAPMAVVIVTYNSADVIEDCLDSLLASEGADLRVIVVDNKSPDNSIETVVTWASRNGLDINDVEVGSAQAPRSELPWLTLLRSPLNKGFAGGVNEGLRWALPHKEIDLFWILNPDCMVEPTTARAFIDCAAGNGEFSLMGGRVVFPAPNGSIQSDGGRIKLWGACYSLNQGLPVEGAITPNLSRLDFISGANMVASRQYIEAVGLMHEDYFLYYEEVDWAARRGSFHLAWCSGAVVAHHVGTSIGSGSQDRKASPLSEYFNNRNRIRFVWRFRRWLTPLSYAGSVTRSVKLLLEGEAEGAWAAFLGTNQLPPPSYVASKIAPEAVDLAFGRRG
jgi:GT2 family glycosyltransferase